MRSTFFFILLASCFPSLAQQREEFLLRENGGLCSHSIILYSDHTYISERGCEASSHVQLGKWVQKKDTIKLQPLNPRMFALTIQIDSLKSNDTLLKVSLYDSEGKNLIGTTSVGQYIKNVGIYKLKPDSSKRYAIDFKRKGGSIIITAFWNLFRQNIEIPIGECNTYLIKLNFSNEWLMNSQADWDDFAHYAFLRRNDQLVDVYPGVGNSKAVYIKQ